MQISLALWYDEAMKDLKRTHSPKEFVPKSFLMAKLWHINMIIYSLFGTILDLLTRQAVRV